MIDSPKFSQAVDDSRRIMALSILFLFDALNPDLPCPGDALYRAMPSMLLQPVRFTDESEFRIFMAGLADAGLVREKHGRTMIEARLDRLFFSITPWIKILLRSAAKGEFQEAFAELSNAAPPPEPE